MQNLLNYFVNPLEDTLPMWIHYLTFAVTLVALIIVFWLLYDTNKQMKEFPGKRLKILVVLLVLTMSIMLFNDLFNQLWIIQSNQTETLFFGSTSIPYMLGVVFTIFFLLLTAMQVVYIRKSAKKRILLYLRGFFGLSIIFALTFLGYVFILQGSPTNPLFLASAVVMGFMAMPLILLAIRGILKNSTFRAEFKKIRVKLLAWGLISHLTNLFSSVIIWLTRLVAPDYVMLIYEITLLIIAVTVVCSVFLFTRAIYPAFYFNKTEKMEEPQVIPSFS